MEKEKHVQPAMLPMGQLLPHITNFMGGDAGCSNMPHPLLTVSQSDYLIQVVGTISHTK